MMYKKIKKFFSSFKQSSFKKQIQQERRRLFVRKKPEFTFKRRKKLHIHIPNFFKYLSFEKRYIKFIYIGILLSIIGVGIFVVYGPFFRIQHIEVLRKDDITNINIAYLAVDGMRDTPMFLLDAKDMAERLKSYQKNIQEVSIKKALPNTLNITISSYPGVFRVEINQKQYTVTKNGVLIPGTINQELPLIKFVEKYTQQSGILDYKQIYNPSSIDSILSVYEKLNANLLGVSIDAFYYFPQERELHVLLSTGNTIIFDLGENIENQIKKLLIYHKESYNLSQKTMIYIDLRIKGKIFFCSTENEYQCRKNLSQIYGY